MFFFFFNETAPTEIYTLSLHDALPISFGGEEGLKNVRLRLLVHAHACVGHGQQDVTDTGVDRKSTRLNSSHANISYAVFCLKKKKKKDQQIQHIQPHNKNELQLRPTQR